MEVNRSNFQDLLPFIETCIDECDFVAIDTEFTGINSNETPTIFDTLPDYYKKLKKGSSEFLVLQLGLVTFKYDVNNNKFLQSAFNFYIFPIPLPGLNRNVNFLCQSQCMSFLASTGFDFNKVFHEGISYLTKAEEETYKTQLDVKRKKRTDNQNNEYTLLNLREQDQKEVDSISKRIEEFLKSAEPNEELVLGKYNSFLRRVIYNNVAERFQGKVGFDIKSNLDEGNSMFTVVAYLRGNKQHQQERENEKQLEEEKNLQQAVGVSYVIRRISESGKLVVGHNMFLDIMHITNHFLQKIPNDYYSFKDIISVCFPSLLDTKHMASCSPFDEKIRYSTLNHLVSTFENPEIDVIPGGKGYTVSADKGHEAAFDAFITGLSFLSMLKFIDCVFPIDYSVLDPYINKIFVFKLTDIPYMNIGGADLKPNRDHVLYASFSSGWKTKDIESFFHGYGRISVVWINDSSAYVCLPNEAAAKKALKGLRKSKQCKLLSFFKYEALMNAAKPLPTKESLKEKKEFPSYPEIPASKIAKLLGCASSPEHDSDEEIEIESEKKPLQILTCSKALTAVKRSVEEDEGNSVDEDEVVPSKKRVFQEDNSWE